MTLCPHKAYADRSWLWFAESDYGNDKGVQQAKMFAVRFHTAEGTYSLLPCPAFTERRTPRTRASPGTRDRLTPTVFGFTGAQKFKNAFEEAQHINREIELRARPASSPWLVEALGEKIRTPRAYTADDVYGGPSGGVLKFPEPDVSGWERQRIGN
jgi:hypothetical protein